MTEQEAIKALEFDMEMILFDAYEGKKRTPEEVKNINEANYLCYLADEMAIKALEKQIAKKVAHQGCYDAKGVLHIWNGINGVPYDLCPSCEINLCTDGCFGRDKSKMKYCENCGQKLDWE